MSSPKEKKKQCPRWREGRRKKKGDKRKREEQEEERLRESLRERRAGRERERDWKRVCFEKNRTSTVNSLY